ncbi:MAG TPA: hypothetical protein VHT96_08955 [Clostridia bacterium]|nr:hypothetical protein [Clostridia bacterium]
MKAGKPIIISGAVIALVIMTFCISFFLLSGPDKEIRRFEKEFGLKMPEETRVIFSEDDHGALGDGTSLFIYQLNTADMSEFIKQEEVRYWWNLPFDEKMSLGITNKLKGVSSAGISSNIRFDAKKGYYLLKNRYGKTLKGYNFEDNSYSNIIIGIVDLDNNKIYYSTLDM